ncbi:MAG: class I tRNA ligase family protein, partial [Usitatibacter sp.]
ITEELWQTVAPLAGKTGKSIMVAPFPRPDDKRIDAQAENEIAMVKEVVNAARNLRSTMGLSPAAKVPLYIADHHASLVGYASQIAAIARLSEVRFVKDLPAEDSPVTVTGCGKVMLHVEIDRGAERARLTKEIARLEGEIGKSIAKLGNASFVERAKPEVVELEKKRLADNEIRLAEVRAQLKRLD